MAGYLIIYDLFGMVCALCTTTFVFIITLCGLEFEEKNGIVLCDTISCQCQRNGVIDCR